MIIILICFVYGLKKIFFWNQKEDILRTIFLKLEKVRLSPSFLLRNIVPSFLKGYSWDYS